MGNLVEVNDEKALDEVNLRIGEGSLRKEPGCPQGARSMLWHKNRVPSWKSIEQSFVSLSEDANHFGLDMNPQNPNIAIHIGHEKGSHAH